MVGSTNLTADAIKGSYAVTVASAAGFSPGQIVLLDEASGAGVAILLLRAALACHNGMATFAQAGVSGRDG